VNAGGNQPEHVSDRGVWVTPVRPRPLLPAAIAFIVGIVAAEYLGTGAASARYAAILLPIVAFVTLIVLVARRKASGIVLCGLVVAAAFGLGFARHQNAIQLPPNHIARFLADEPILSRVAGQIVTQPTTIPGEKRNPFLSLDPPARTRFVLAARELRTADPPISIAGYIRVSVEAESIGAHMGDAVVLTGQLYRPRGPRNPGETDWAAWNRSQNIHAGMKVEGAVHVRRIDSGGSTARGLIGSLRARAQSMLFEPFTEVDSDQPVRLLDAMVLGHRSAAGREVNEAFLRTGGLHFLAVSGFHVGVLAGAVWFFTRRVLRRGARTTALATIIVLVLYALIVEHNAPIMRATTMGVLLCLALLARRPLCGLNWLAFAAICILTRNPLELFGAGFQLSFVQVLALLTIVPRVYRLVVYRHRDDEVPADADSWPRLIARRFSRSFVGLAIVCVCAWIVALPLVLLHFGRFAPWGAIQSIVISPLVMLTIVLGFLTLILSAVVPPVGAAVGVILRAVTDLLLWAVDHLSHLPGTLVDVIRPPALLVIATYATLSLALWACLGRGETTTGGGSLADKRGPRRRLTLGLLTVSMIPVLWIAWWATPVFRVARDCCVHVLSVGSGAAVLVTAPGGDALLYDVGTIHNSDAGQTVVQAARTLGIGRLNALVISHANYDHYSGAPSVLRDVPTERLHWSRYTAPPGAESPGMRRLLGLLPAQSAPRAVLRAGDRFTLGDAPIEVLWPPDDLDESWDVNDRSLVLRILANGRKVLLPGDIERPALRELLRLHEAGKIDLRSDVLLAPHHGAVVPVDTAAFYKAVRPSVIINSTSRERPKLTELVSETLGEDVRLLSTDEVGAVTVRITRESGITVETPFTPAVTLKSIDRKR
jgi:competence protein ComEC